MSPVPRTPPLPALAEDIIVIKLPQLQLLQLLLKLQPRSVLGPHVPPTPPLPALAEGTIVILPHTPLHPALAEGTAVIARLPQLLQLQQLPQL